MGEGGDRRERGSLGTGEESSKEGEES